MIFAESNRATPIEPQTTRFYSQNCFPTTPQLPPKHQTLFAKLLSRYAPTTSQPPESIRKTALPPRPNDPQTTRFYSPNCSATTPLLPPNHKNLFAKLLSYLAPTISKPSDSIRKTTFPPRPSTPKPPESIRKTALPPHLHYLPTTELYAKLLYSDAASNDTV